MSGYTSGPWHCRANRANGDALIEDAQDQVIGATYGDTGLPAEANARLIAAAPELLEALQAYVANDANQGLDDDEIYANAVEAINKATGVTK